jgi:NOL1/NOP2/fmu family ribosome biogenesis protein
MALESLPLFPLQRQRYRFQIEISMAFISSSDNAAIEPSQMAASGFD